MKWLIICLVALALLCVADSTEHSKNVFTQEDKFWVTEAWEKANKLTDILNGVYEADAGGNYKALERKGEALKRETNRSLKEETKYNLSTALRPAQEAWILSLKSGNQAGNALVLYAKSNGTKTQYMDQYKQNESLFFKYMKEYNLLN